MMLKIVSRSIAQIHGLQQKVKNSEHAKKGMPSKSTGVVLAKNPLKVKLETRNEL